MSIAVDVTPWPHQLAAVEGVEAAVADGCRRVLVTSPTGGGKTWVMCELIRRWTEQGLRTVLYTNRKLLLDQTARVLTGHGIDYGVRAAGWEHDHEQPVQVSSLQTEGSRVLKRRVWELHDADRVLVDEAHIQTGKVAARILEAHHAAGAAYVGLTATPLDLGHLYDRLIVAGTTSELRTCGALVPAHHYGPDEPDLRHIGRVPLGEDLTEAQNVKAIMVPGIFGRVYDWWQRLNPDARPAILFAPGVAESIWFCEQFSEKGVRCAHIDGAECWLDGKTYTSNGEKGRQLREDILAGSEDGSIKVLANRFVLREGIDCPWLYHGILATVFGSLQSYLQSGGRLLRAHPSLDHVVIQDHGGNWWRHGSLNEDRHWELQYTAAVVSALREDALRYRKCKRCRARLGKGPLCPGCGMLNAPQPASCPECRRVLNGPRCPCGFTLDLSRKSRPVVQADGTLKEQGGDVFRPRPERRKANTEDVWRKTYYRARNSGMTFRQAMGLFVHENHYWPPRDLPMMPAGEMDWFRKVNEVPPERLNR